METRQPHYQLSPELPPTPGPEAGPTFNPAPQESISPQSSDPQVFEAGRYSPETRARMSEAQKGKKRSPETRARMSEAQKGKKHSPETRTRISEAQKGKKRSPESRARMSEAQKGKRVSPETRARMSEAQKGERNPNYGKNPSPETRAKISKANKGKKRSPESRARMSEVHKGKKHSPETKARMSEAQKGKRNPNYGKKPSPETRARISKANKGKKRSPESRARVSEAQKGGKNHRYDRSIDKPRLAIADHVRGESLVQASRNQGFFHTWLGTWKSRHPERFQAIYMEEAAALDQLTIQRAIGAHALGASIREASLSVGMEPDWLPVWKKAHPAEFQRLLDREQSGIGLTRQVLDLRYDENLAATEASRRLELEPDQLD